MKTFILTTTMLVFMGCSSQEAHLINDARIKLLSDNTFRNKTYRLPKASFRGVNWNFKRDKAFKLWLIDGEGNDFDIFIPITENFMSFDEEDLYKNWNVKIKENPQKQDITYMIKHKIKRIELNISLPFENKKYYQLAMLSNSQNDHLIVYMNMSNYIKHKNDNGIFGYILINGNN